MADEGATFHAGNITIKGVSDESLTVEVNGEIKQIRNQLEELKGLLLQFDAQKVQYADKIYNIGSINEANFGFITGKKAFNELLTRELIEQILPYCQPAQKFMAKVKQIENWEKQARISDKAKEVIAYSFVGVIGIQLSKLMAIGKEDISEAKQRKYIEQCLHLVKRCFDLINFSLLSILWDALKDRQLKIQEAERSAIARRLDTAFEPTIEDQYFLLSDLHRVFSRPENSLSFPLQELEGLRSSLDDKQSDFRSICRQLLRLNQKLDQAQFDLLDCFEAEKRLADFFRFFPFLVNYRMASIKHIGYRQIRNDEPHYLHRYVALGIDNKSTQNAERINYTPRTVHTDTVLLYSGEDYNDYINLFPFVIDYNALTLEKGVMICFFRSQDIGGEHLEYLVPQDNHIVHLEKKGILKPGVDVNELMMDEEKRVFLNLDSVVDQFFEARNCLLNNSLDFDDL